MCTITLEYNQNNVLARRNLKEVDTFLAHSKKSMSSIIARYL